MNGMDEWQAIQNEKIRLMEIVETGVAEKNAEIDRLRTALLVIKGLIEGDWGMEQIREVVTAALRT